MNTEQHYLSRVEEPSFFLAQDNLPADAICCECEKPIEQGDIVSEGPSETFIHERCWIP